MGLRGDMADMLSSSSNSKRVSYTLAPPGYRLESLRRVARFSETAAAGPAAHSTVVIFPHKSAVIAI